MGLLVNGFFSACVARGLLYTDGSHGTQGRAPYNI